MKVQLKVDSFIGDVSKLFLQIEKRMDTIANLVSTIDELVDKDIQLFLI